jgi:hypothetical protein
MTSAWRLAAFAVVLGAGCNEQPDPLAEQAAAEAFGRTLPMAEVADRIPDDATPEDSVELADRILDTWFREQVLLEQALTNLSDEELDVEREVERYRNALLLHRYEDLYIARRLDTEVSDNEARALYDAQPELFRLNDYVVRAQFLHVPVAEERELPKVRKLLQSNNPAEFGKLEAWCIAHSAVHSLDPETWWYLDDLLREVPFQIYRPADQIADRRLIEFTSGGRIYLLRFRAHAMKDAQAPFDVVRPRIDELILHSRRQELLRTLADDLLREAWADEDLRILVGDSAAAD